MKIEKFENEKDWLNAREGIITGTKLKGIIPKKNGGYKVGFYQLIAERIAVPPTFENPMDRGKRLEEIAIEEFEKKTKKKVNKDLVIWHRNDDERIAISPDGFIGKKEAIEVKCLSSAQFIEAWLTKKIPSEYEPQALQYFIVNDDLQKLYFTFYDPRMPKPLFWIEIKRKDVQDKVKKYLKFEKEVLKKIDKIEKEFTF